MNRAEKIAELSRLGVVSRELMAAKKVSVAMPTLDDKGVPSIRILDLQGNWRVIDELTSRGL